MADKYLHDLNTISAVAGADLLAIEDTDAPTDLKQMTVAVLKTFMQSAYTASRAMETNGAGVLGVSAITSTELGYLNNLDVNLKVHVDNVTTIHMPSQSSKAGSYLSTDGSIAIWQTFTIGATDIDDFAITASKVFNNIPIISEDNWTDDDPTAGKIAWDEHNITYGGAYYLVAAGNTSSALHTHVYWDVGNTGGAGTVDDPYLTTYASQQGAPTMTDTRFIIATNISGQHNVAWNSIANSVIGTAHILDASIIDAKIVNLNATKIDAGDIAVSRITAQAGNAINAGAISISANRINIAGTTVFSSGWAAASNAETDINVLNTTNAPADAGATDDTVANEKAEVFRQNTAPGSGMVTGDMWIDTDDGDRPYIYSGTAWDEILTIIDGGTITTGIITGRTIRTAASGKRALMSGADGLYYVYNTNGDEIVRLGYALEEGYLRIQDGTPENITTINSGAIIIQAPVASVRFLMKLNTVSKMSIASDGDIWTAKDIDVDGVYKMDGVTIIDSGGNIHLQAGKKIFFDGASNSDAIFADASELKFLHTSVEQMHLTATGECNVRVSLAIAGTQVISSQGAAVANATGAGDVVAQLNALLARLRTHGLIAT